MNLGRVADALEILEALSARSSSARQRAMRWARFASPLNDATDSGRRSDRYLRDSRGRMRRPDAGRSSICARSPPAVARQSSWSRASYERGPGSASASQGRDRSVRRKEYWLNPTCGVSLVYGTHKRRYRRQSLRCGDAALPVENEARGDQLCAADPRRRASFTRFGSQVAGQWLERRSRSYAH